MSKKAKVMIQFADGTIRSKRTVNRIKRVVLEKYSCLVSSAKMVFAAIHSKVEKQRLKDWVEVMHGTQPDMHTVGQWILIALHVAATRIGKGHSIDSLVQRIITRRSAQDILLI